MLLRVSFCLVLICSTLQQVLADDDILTPEQARKLNPETGTYKVYNDEVIPNKYKINLKADNGVTIGCYGYKQEDGNWQATNYISNANQGYRTFNDLDIPIDIVPDSGVAYQLVFSEVLQKCGAYWNQYIQNIDRQPSGSINVIKTVPPWPQNDIGSSNDGPYTPSTASPWNRVSPPVVVSTAKSNSIWPPRNSLPIGTPYTYGPVNPGKPPFVEKPQFASPPPRNTPPTDSPWNRKSDATQPPVVFVPGVPPFVASPPCNCDTVEKISELFKFTQPPTVATTPRPTPTWTPRTTPPTKPPVTRALLTRPPVTNPPVTRPPVTRPPVTRPPVTQPPVIDRTTQPRVYTSTKTVATTPRPTTTWTPRTTLPIVSTPKPTPVIAVTPPFVPKQQDLYHFAGTESKPPAVYTNEPPCDGPQSVLVDFPYSKQHNQPIGSDASNQISLDHCLCACPNTKQYPVIVLQGKGMLL